MKGEKQAKIPIMGENGCLSVNASKWVNRKIKMFRLRPL